MLALVGLALAAFDWEEFAVSWAHIRTALGESLIVAAALGLTVDFFYKRELARDAFEASLGYLLPEELKAELRWIYGQQLVCVEHEQHVVLRPTHPGEPGPGKLRVEFETWRTIRNVSNERVEVPTYSSVEEWFRGEESGIELIEWVQGDRRSAGGRLVGDEERSGAALAPSQLDHRRPGVERTLDEPVVLGPGEEATFRYRGHEIHYESGMFQDIYGAPTLRSMVTVDAPAGTRAEVWFGNRGRAQATEMGGRYVLPSVLLPFQPIVVRWWPEAAHDAWRERRRAGASADP